MKADLHVHSTYSSDGRTTPQKIIESAADHGLGCVAITDHNSFKAFYDVKNNGRIIIVPGEEVSSSEGHIIALGIDKEIEPRKSVKETIDLIHAAGGLAFAAHPYRWWSGLGVKNVIDDFDGIEALNGRSTRGSNKKSLALAHRIGKPMSAGSDSHTILSIGDGYVEIPDTCRTWQDVIEALRAKQAVPHSRDRGIMATLKYGWKAITKWMGRGFKRM